MRRTPLGEYKRKPTSPVAESVASLRLNETAERSMEIQSLRRSLLEV